MVAYDRVETDVLVMGMGGAGLRAALEIVSRNLKVVLVSKSLLGKAHTVMAEGGIAAAVANVDSKDSWQVHFSDTVAEGVYIGDYRMAEILAKEAPERVYELERYGALFDRTPDGKIMQRAFGGHTYRRLCHVGDKTGLEMIRTLEDRVLHTGNAKLLDETVITKLLACNGSVCGAVGFSLRTGKFIVFECKAIIVATGGLGRIYKVSSNSHETTGDGIAMAFEAGAELRDMEMVQFHPTGMVYPPGVRGLLVTEGVRGEGGLLFNTKGERFMLRYSPEKKELDARDVVARAIYHEIQNGNGTEHGGVYLDITKKGAAFIRKKLPGMYEQFKEFAGVDITKEKMEVAPTVHYFMGGIRVEPETARTNVNGLFAVGEAAAGLHGANRLGGNSLADILVFGRRAGISAATYAATSVAPKLDYREAEAEISRINSFIDEAGRGSTNPYEIIDELRDTMSSKVGIIRNGKDLNSALQTITVLKERAKSVTVKGGVRFNQGLLGCIEMEKMLLVAECVVRSAIYRKESRGAHTRSDFPNKLKEWKLNIICARNGSKIDLSTVPVPEMPEELNALVKPEVYA
ncbi:MAG: FAD-binding protein [Candidatus Marsarchaeota archaeon]|nr:FAD-binding protein [Candidatus Marsarchaeota archaeon]